MIIEIPGYKTLDLDYLVLDYNGTIAVDGLIPPAIKERLLLLGDSFKIYVLTADTHGTAAAMCKDNNIPILVFNLAQPENIVKAGLGEPIGTIVK